MIRIFEDSGITVKGNILPIEEFRFFRDLKDKKVSAEDVAKHIALAEAALEEPIPQLTLSSYRDYFISGKRDPYDADYRRRRSMMIELALGEYFENKGRFTVKLADVIFAILEESTWVIPPHAKNSPENPLTQVPDVYRPDQLHAIDLRSTSTAAMLAGVYTLVKEKLDEITPVIAKRMQWQTLDRTVRPYLQHEFWWGGNVRDPKNPRPNNWCTHCVLCTLVATAVFEADQERREEVVRRALTHLDNFTAHCPEDGGCDEGPGYWAGAAGALFTAIELLYDMSGGKIDLTGHPFVRLLGEYELNMYIDGARFANFADSHANTYLDERMLYRYGIRTGSSALVDLARLTANAKLTPPTADSFFRYGCFYQAMKGLYTPVPCDGIGDIHLPRASWLSALKIATFRERCDGTGIYFAIKGGTNAESHNHNDVGSFLLYKNGNPVLIDAGSADYNIKTFSAERYTIWNMQSHYHNLPVVDGIGQHNGILYASKNERFDAAAQSVEMELTDAYEKEAGVLSFVRKATVADGTVTLTDTISLEKTAPVEFRFLTARKPVLEEEGMIALAEGMKLYYDKALRFEVVEITDPTLHTDDNFGTDVLYQIRLSMVIKDAEFVFVIK